MVKSLNVLKAECFDDSGEMDLTNLVDLVVLVHLAIDLKILLNLIVDLMVLLRETNDVSNYFDVDLIIDLVVLVT